MQVFIVIYLLFLGLLALLAQMVLPIHFPILNFIGFGSALIPLIVIYASLELGDIRALIVAGLLGLLLDLTSYHHRLGVSSLILCLISSLILTQTHKPESHHWVFRLAFVLVGTFGYLLLDYLCTLVEAGRWYWPLAAVSKITFASFLNLLLFPLFFLLAGLLPRLTGWKPAYEINDRFRSQRYV